MSQGVQEIFISYARKNDPGKALVRQLKDLKTQVHFYQSGLNEENEYVKAGICFDEEKLNYGGSIEGFMQQVARAEHLMLLISDEYLKSPYCMYECLNAYNVIENRFLPAMVFIDSPHQNPILHFDEKGLPKIDIERFKSHWTEQSDNLPTSDPARLWYRKYIRMAEEIEAWLIGRRWGGRPARLLPCYTEPADNAVLQQYISWALKPPKNQWCCSSSDRLLEQCLEAICAELRNSPNLEKAMNHGAAFSSPEHRRQFIDEKLYDNAALFVSNQLAPALEKAAQTISQPLALNTLRKSADRIFGQLVKFGVRMDTLHHQLQQLNGQSAKSAPYAVASESVLPEMTDAYLQNRQAGYRRIDENGEVAYIGRKEFVVTRDNTLEIDETKQDAMEQLDSSFIDRVADLVYTEEDGKRRRRPGPELLAEKIRSELVQRAIIIKIEGISKADAQRLVDKLHQNELLRELPIFVEVSEQDNAIKTTNEWYDAIWDYYEVRDQLIN